MKTFFDKKINCLTLGTTLILSHTSNVCMGHMEYFTRSPDWSIHADESEVKSSFVKSSQSNLYFPRLIGERITWNIPKKCKECRSTSTSKLYERVTISDSFRFWGSYGGRISRSRVSYVEYWTDRGWESTSETHRNRPLHTFVQASCKSSSLEDLLKIILKTRLSTLYNDSCW